MLNSKEVALTDIELDQVAGGFLPIVAAAAVGAFAGVGILATAVAVGDAIRHAQGNSCIFE
jgi:lactobin A/cerein 7B family class IIb bacteriocin